MIPTTPTVANNCPTPVLGESKPFSGLCGHMWYTYIYARDALIDTTLNLIFLKKLVNAVYLHNTWKYNLEIKISHIYEILVALYIEGGGTYLRLALEKPMSSLIP